MSQFPDPERPSPQSPAQQSYPGSAPAQFDPRASTLPPRDRPPVNMPPWPEPGQTSPPAWQNQPQPQAAGFRQVPPVPAGYGYGETGGLAVPAGLYLDQQSGLVLPQGTQLASPGRRIGAFFLSIPLAIATLFIGYIIWGLLVWGNGQTPALQVLGMRCYRPEENRVAGFWWMALREVVGRILDGILSIITELTSFIMMLTRPDRKALHDLVAGTVVLHDPDKVLSK
jgi:uncharacterized RDD family membrane protein YckC